MEKSYLCSPVPQKPAHLIISPQCKQELESPTYIYLHVISPDICIPYQSLYCNMCPVRGKLDIMHFQRDLRRRFAKAFYDAKDPGLH